MTILLYKDGKLIVDDEQPLEGVSLENLAAILSGANDGDVIQYDSTNGMWVNKSAPSSLPEVTASDKGKYLKANESTGDPEWAEGGSSGGGVLVVHETFTGTANTLDKTFKQIEDGMTSGSVVIVFEYEGTGGGTRIVTGTYKESGLYEVYSTSDITYSADSEDGYPYFEV